MYNEERRQIVNNLNLQEESMKKLLLIVGIISLIACALSLLFSAFSWYGYYHVLDGSAELYVRLHQRMLISFIVGIVLVVIGIASLIIRSKI